MRMCSSVAVGGREVRKREVCSDVRVSLAAWKGGRGRTHDGGVGGRCETALGGVLGQNLARDGVVGTVVCRGESQPTTLAP